MKNRDIGAEVLEGIAEIQAYKKGGTTLKVTELVQPSPAQVIRAKLHLSQLSFAGLLGVSVRTLQDWEQGRRQPQGPAVALLRIAEQYPEVFTRLS
jgi:putative transcriptional regulator